MPEVTIEEQIAAQVPPVVISLADAPPTQDDVIGVEQDETKTASEFGYIPSELAATEYPPSFQAGDIPSEAADSLSVRQPLQFNLFKGLSYPRSSQRQPMSPSPKPSSSQSKFCL